MTNTFYPRQTDYIEKLNEMADAQILPAQADWNATSGIGFIKNKPAINNVDNTSDVNKPVSIAQQAALDLKAPKESPTFTGTVSGVTKTMVGLGNVDNTSDTIKPVSTAQQTALDLKAPKASPTFTGTVSGITKSMVGLGNVDNTSDASKPVSTAQQTALDTKVQNGTGVGQVTSSMVKIGFTGSTLNRIKATVDTTDFGNIAMEAAANTFTQLQMFSGRAGASSSTFNPATTDWVKAASYTQGTKGGGVAVIDNANSAGGVMWAESAVLRFGTGTFSTGTPAILDVQSGFVTPSTDNVTSLGSFNRRWTNVYATTGTVQTSSAAHKTPVVVLSAAEISAAIQLATEVGKFKFLDAVEEKGEAARNHIGLTVQRAIAVMQEHGLTPFDYGFICYDSWPEQITEHAEMLDEEGNVVRAAYTETQPAGEIYSFRPDELSLFLARGQSARLSVLEQRLAALESASS